MESKKWFRYTIVAVYAAMLIDYLVKTHKVADYYDRSFGFSFWLLAILVSSSVAAKINATLKREEDYRDTAIRFTKRALYGSIGKLVFFLIVSKNMVYKLFIDKEEIASYLAFYSAAFWSKCYGIFEEHYSIISIFCIIECIATLRELKNKETEPYTVPDYPKRDEQPPQRRNESVTPAKINEHRITCPLCGYEQPSTRKMCWQCSARFETGEKTDPERP